MNDNYAFAGERINAKYWIHISMELIALVRGLRECVCARLCALLMMSHQQQQQQHCRKIVSNYAYTGISEQTTHINIYTHTHTLHRRIYCLHVCVCVCARLSDIAHFGDYDTLVDGDDEYLRWFSFRIY